MSRRTVIKVEIQHYLDLIERDPNGIVFWDLETTGLKGDYNSIICASLKPYGKKPFSFTVKQVGNDQKLVRELGDALEEYHVWATYYGKGFDVLMANTRRLKWGLNPIQSRHHLDFYYILKAHTLTGRRSMAAMASFLGTKEQKMSVGQEVWSEIAFKLDEHLPTMIKRCESDCAVLEDVYRKSRHLIKDMKL
jgi:uncharacterized protein YprB with RNaseH-like and TPR domain